jgi:hypothetical protein
MSQPRSSTSGWVALFDGAARRADLVARVAAGLDQMLGQLGIPGAPEISVQRVPDDARPLRVQIGDSVYVYADEWTERLGEALAGSGPPSTPFAWSQLTADASGLDFLARIVVEIVKRHPERMLTADQRLDSENGNRAARARRRARRNGQPTGPGGVSGGVRRAAHRRPPAANGADQVVAGGPRAAARSRRGRPGGDLRSGPLRRSLRGAPRVPVLARTDLPHSVHVEVLGRITP